jgi:hypothetical protein
MLQAADGRWGSFGGEKARGGLHFDGARVVDGQAVCNANQLRMVGSCRREEEWLRFARAAALSFRDSCCPLSLCGGVELGINASVRRGKVAVPKNTCGEKQNTLKAGNKIYLRRETKYTSGGGRPLGALAGRRRGVDYISTGASVDGQAI